MGWTLWSSTPSGTESTGSSSSPPQPTVSSMQTPPPRPNTHREDIISPSAAAAAVAESPPPRTLTRDELAEVELRAFLDEINASLSSTTPNASPISTSTPQPTPSSPLHPTTQSCSTLFDSAFYCQSLGGQFMNVYRYGGIKDCSEHWGAFWFCMRNRSYGEEEKRQRVQEFYKEKDKRYLKGVGPSCEDIWTARTEGERVVDAFNQDPEMDDAGKRAVSG